MSGAKTAEYLRDRIISLAKDVFNIDFNEYLKSHSDREFWGAVIDKDKCEYRGLFGNPDKKFIEIANNNFYGTEAGYCVDVANKFDDLNVNADVFFINQDRLKDTELDLEALIIHEICHMVIDANIRFRIKPEDELNGIKQFEKLDKFLQDNPTHDLHFYKVLAAAAREASSIYDYKDSFDVMNRAMKYDTYGDEYLNN